MTLTITTNGSAVLLSGDLDMQTAPSLLAELTDLIGAANAGDEVRVDLGGVTLVDSSGLSVLVDAHKLAVAGGARLLLAALPQHMERTLGVTGLSEVLEIAPDAG